jgi:hypothetical protein
MVQVFEIDCDFQFQYKYCINSMLVHFLQKEIKRHYFHTVDLSFCGIIFTASTFRYFLGQSFKSLIMQIQEFDHNLEWDLSCRFKSLTIIWNGTYLVVSYMH